MEHRVTRALFDYWKVLRGARPAPDRGEIDPGAIRSCLPSTFILTCDAQRGHPFRIAGTSLCEMFGAELTGTPFDQIWNSGDRPSMSDLIQRIAEDAEGAVADVTGRNADAESADLEMILLPLAGGDAGAGRILGALAAPAAPYWFGTRPLQSLRLGNLRYASANADLRLSPERRRFRPGALSSSRLDRPDSTKLLRLTRR